jgi:hypothetical protein
MFAWATVPGIEAIHYAYDSSTIFISNRPMAIAAALVGDGGLTEIDLDQDYLLDYISFGFSMSGGTPFSRVSTVPADHALSVYQGEFAIVPAPPQPPKQISPVSNDLHTGAQELLDALRNATQRKITALGDQPLQLRLSGGKDSRLMLALLLDAGVRDIVAVTQGGSTSEEAMVAADLAELAGIEHRIKLASLNVPTSVYDSVVQSVRDSQGMLLSEALGMPYAFADPISTGEGYAAGQWPTFKAPYVRKKAHPLSDLDQEWHAHTADNLSPDMYDRASRAMRNWVASAPSVSNNEILYLYGRNVRSTNYMHASSIAIDSYSMIFFPFVDAEVTAVADVLPAHAKRSELPIFLALRELWSESLAVPLARGGKFRFESGGPLAGVSGSDFDSRRKKPQREVAAMNPDYLDQASDRSLLKSPLKEGASFILDSPHWSQLRSYISIAFARRLEQLASAETEHEVLSTILTSRRQRVFTRVGIWRLISADAWLSRRWLTV